MSSGAGKPPLFAQLCRRAVVAEFPLRQHECVDARDAAGFREVTQRCISPSPERPSHPGAWAMALQIKVQIDRLRC
jgi:hypothetical protein